MSKIYASNPLAANNEKERTAALPAPSSYNVLEAFNASATKSPRGNWGKLTDKRVNYVDTIAKKSISPGPANHSYSITSLNLLSKSPATSRSRL